ncbi:MAG: type II toxin-antitoxin system VapC family toxin [Anaerolineae bacterium]|nr:type II toxin-antitoxin system VapC family toxin [Anaerolineae bacterium]
MTKYLLDTNHASRLMADDAGMLAHLRRAQYVDNEFSVSITVVGELYYAVYASRRHLDNRQRLTRLLNAVNIYPFDHSEAEEFGRIQAEQKAKGLPIPPLDAQIAAVARYHGLTVLTADKHFGMVDGLLTENWLT